MPYLRDVPGDRLELPSNPDYWVLMKRRAAYGDVAAAQKASFDITPTDAALLNGRDRRKAVVDQRSGRAVVADFDAGAYLPTLLARLILDWNLDDANGDKLPITVQSLALLDAEDGDFLQAEAQARAGGRPKDQQDPSRKPSSESSPVGAAGQRTERQPDN